MKKDNPNKGRKFYTCDVKKCNFFLWESDAQVREREALMTHNCRSENGLVGRVQARDDPPATPVFAPKTAPPPPPPQQQQRLFSGPGGAMGINWPSSASQASQDSSDYVNYYTDDGADETQQPQRGRSGSLAELSGGSSHTLQNSSGPGSKSSSATAAAATPRGRMPDFTYQRQEAATPSAKRKRGAFPADDSDDEFGGDDLDDPDVERALAAAERESVRKRLFQTPALERAVGRMGDGGGGGGGEGGLPTPKTRTNRNSLLISEQDRARDTKRARFMDPFPGQDETQSQSQSLPAGQGHALHIGSLETPTPYRKTDALAPASFSISDSQPTTPSANRGLLKEMSPSQSSSLFKTPPAPSDYPRITDEVMALLAGQPISEAARRGVKQACDRHEMRVKGVARGRDVSRAEVRARDQRIHELQEQVVVLENARRFERERMRGLLSDGLVSLTQEDE